MIYLEVKVPLDIAHIVLEEAAEKTLAVCGVTEVDLGILLGGDDDTHELNQRFLGIDAPTDVLSFPAGELDPETGRRYLGDVVISRNRAADQAARRGHPLQAELQLLVVHGVLHLLGYDHARLHKKNKMWEMQGTILGELGLIMDVPES